jgi:tRNA threonylcarbamoyladenosine biosynthesis protein TsaE
MNTIYLPDAEATEGAGSRLAAWPGLPAVRQIHLRGPLGAGKTTFVRGLLRGLGHEGTVRSPTFTLVEPYVLSGMTLLHLDLYRLADPDELDYLGLHDYGDDSVLWLVEWPERGAGWLPKPDLSLQLELVGNGRCLQGLEGAQPELSGWFRDFAECSEKVI